MRLAGTVVALALALPSLADARPIMFGVGLGRTQSEVDADGEANGTQQLFGRIGFTSRLAAQVEVQRIDDPSVDIRTGTVLLVVELGSKGSFVPLLVAGFGFDKASSDWYEASGTHKEGGFGLEYRAEGGLTIGADVRLGGRSVAVSGEIDPARNVTALYAPTGLPSGEYRSGRLYAAIRF